MYTIDTFMADLRERIESKAIEARRCGALPDWMQHPDYDQMLYRMVLQIVAVDLEPVHPEYKKVYKNLQHFI